jgi:hypothetical protein
MKSLTTFMVIGILLIFTGFTIAQTEIDPVMSRAYELLTGHEPPQPTSAAPELTPQQTWAKEYQDVLQSAAVVRFADSVIAFSSEYTTGSWAASQILGAPNVYPGYGDNAAAWAQATADGQREWIELYFSNPEPISAISIYETLSPGAVDTVYIKNPNTGEWEIVWSGTAAPAPAAARIFTVYFPLSSFNVSDIRLAINSPAVASWNEYDAVSISQEEPPVPPPFHVNTMPSNTVSTAYANALAGVGIDVWGNARGGTPPYTYKIEFGDGTSSTGAVSDPHYIGEAHSYATAGPKTMTLTVYDAGGDSSKSQSLINVSAVPTKQVRINMAIEKGLLFLYLSQYPEGYWFDTYGYTGATGASLLAFQENGHLATNDFDQDIYAEFVRRGLNNLLLNATTFTIYDQPAGNPDADGDSLGAYLNYDNYANGIGLLGLLGAHPSAESAQADMIEVGPYTGQSVYDFMVDAIDQLAFSQNDSLYGYYRGGWQYAINTPAYGAADNSAVQWPALVIEAAENNWGMAVHQFMKDELLFWLQASQDTTDGGFGYTGSPGYWNNIAKTGSGIGSYAALDYHSTSPEVQLALSFLDAHWYDGPFDDVGYEEQWDGNLYSMYAVAKSMRIIDSRVGIIDIGMHNWYDEYSDHLLSHPTWGQTADGSYNVNGSLVGWANSRPLNTALALLVLTQGVLVAPPVAIIDPISSQPPNISFPVKGSSSFHQDPTKSIIEYLWDWDASNGVNWNNPDATGILPTNPGYADTGSYVITLRVKDDSEPSLYDFETRTVIVNTGNNAPIAIPIDPDRGPSYAAKIGQPILLDGSASFDPDPGDMVVGYNWDTNGDGIFGDALTDTVTIVFNDEYEGQVGLRVYDTHGDSSKNVAFIKIASSLKDIEVIEFAVSPEVIEPGQSVDVFAVFRNNDTSNVDLENVLVRFYNENPLTIGNQMGGDFYVDLPVGETDTINASVIFEDNSVNADIKIAVFLDPLQQVAEWNERNNLAFQEVVVGIESKVDQIPKAFKLHQNFPNPFNPTTTIAFDLPISSEIILTIHDILGRRVRVLYSGRLNAGSHSLVWDAKDQNGISLSTGVYVYRIAINNTNGSYSNAKKMLLVK